MENFRLDKNINSNDIRQIFLATKLSNKNKASCLIKIYDKNIVDNTNYKKCSNSFMKCKIINMKQIDSHFPSISFIIYLYIS